MGEIFGDHTVGIGKRILGLSECNPMFNLIEEILIEIPLEISSTTPGT